MHQVGPDRGVDLVPRRHDWCCMQIHLGSTWAFLSSKWLKANENWPQHGWKETQMGVVWVWYLRQLCLVFNFTGIILNGAEYKPLGNIIFQHLMQHCDILRARWKASTPWSRSRTNVNLVDCSKQGGSQDDVPQSFLYLHQINSDLQLGWHPGPQDRNPNAALHSHLSQNHGEGWGCRHLGEHQTLRAAPALQQCRTRKHTVAL